MYGVSNFFLFCDQVFLLFLSHSLWIIQLNSFVHFRHFLWWEHFIVVGVAVITTLALAHRSHTITSLIRLSDKFPLCARIYAYVSMSESVGERDWAAADIPFTNHLSCISCTLYFIVFIMHTSLFAHIFFISTYMTFHLADALTHLSSIVNGLNAKWIQ